MATSSRLAARRSVHLFVATALFAIFAGKAGAAAPSPAAAPLPVFPLDERPAFPLPAHLEQRDIAAGMISPHQLVEDGRLLFTTSYNGLDGVGMAHTVGGKPLNRFSIGPAGGGQPTPVASLSCVGCHGTPYPGGGGPPLTRTIFDDDRDGNPPFRVRSTTSLFGDGLLQLLAEEMTEELQGERDAAAAAAKAEPGTPVERSLTAKGVAFGSLSATADAASGTVSFDTSAVRGVAPDLVVRPFGWKGDVATLRAFQALPATFGMGMMAEEIVWRLPKAAGDDPDGDGVVRELSVGDITAMVAFNASIQAPSELPRLAAAGRVAPLSPADTTRIERGRALFAQVGCASCHRPELQLANAVYEEPTLRGNGNYVDHFLLGKDPDYDPKRPVRVDLAAGGPSSGVDAAPGGGYVVRLYGDLERHHMGRQLADPVGPEPSLTPEIAPLEIDGKPPLIAADEFLTAELWGVGNTGPWLHDDRAGTLAEAIALHGEDSPPPVGDPGRSEAQEARDAYLALSSGDRAAVIAFLKSLVTDSTVK